MSAPQQRWPLSVKDPTAQDLLWEYAQRHRPVDAEFSADLEEALRTAGFVAPTKPTLTGGHGEDGCPLCGKPSVVVRTGPALVHRAVHGVLHRLCVCECGAREAMSPDAPLPGR